MVVAGLGRVNSAPTAGDPQGSDAFSDEAARALASEPLFAPLAALLASFRPRHCSALETLNDALDAVEPRPGARPGHAIRCVPPDRSRLGYEARVHARGEVVTRPGNWHDFFNALVWLRFPHTKAALNALHFEEMGEARSTPGRGALRDAATQFDESGIAVLARDPVLLELLQARRWHELLWQRRADVLAAMRFLVIGHGLYDALRTPFYRMCGRAALILADAAVIASDVAAQCRYADAVLAERFSARTWYPRPKTLMALPLLGIPGVCAESESAQYYLDTLQFRPPPEDE